MSDVPTRLPIVRLGDFAKIVSGGTPSRANPAFWGGDIPWVKTGDIRNGRIGADDIDERITEAGLKGSSARMVTAGTVLMAMYGQGGTRGRVSMLETDAAISQNSVAFILADGVDSGYVFQLLRHEYARLRSMSNAGGLDFLSSGALLSLRVPLPALEQQQRIARILAIWDVAVDKANALIRAEAVRREGLIQTVVDRPSNEWREVRLGNVGDLTGAGVDKNSLPGEQAVVLANFLDVMRKDLLTARDLSQWVTAPNRKVESCNLRRGDILFTPSSEIRGDIARSAVVAEDVPGGVYSYHVLRLRLATDWDLAFRAYAFKTNHFYRQAYRLCEGSGQRYVLNLSTFRDMTVRVPDLVTQRRIGKALATADRGIDRLKQLRDRYRRQKTGIAARFLSPGGATS